MKNRSEIQAEVDHIFESGANEIRIMTLIDSLMGKESVPSNYTPAYPTYFEGSGGAMYQDGMTLLDYFAGQYLQGWTAQYGDSINIDLLSKTAYVTAAAMLEARKQYIK